MGLIQFCLSLVMAVLGCSKRHFICLDAFNIFSYFRNVRVKCFQQCPRIFDTHIIIIFLRLRNPRVTRYWSLWFCHLVTLSLCHSVTLSLGHLITWLFSDLVIRSLLSLIFLLVILEWPADVGVTGDQTIEWPSDRVTEWPSDRVTGRNEGI